MMGFLTYIILNIQIISTSVSIVAMVNNSALQSQALSNNGTLACVMNIANTTRDTHHKVRICVKILYILTEYNSFILDKCLTQILIFSSLIFCLKMSFGCSKVYTNMKGSWDKRLFSNFVENEASCAIW